MTHNLQIDSSGRTNASVSRQLSAQIVEKLGGQTTHRDLLTHPLPQLDEAWLGANWTPADQLTEQQAEKLATSDSLIQEIKDADTLVIGVSMYNFGIPASLKAWVDLVCRAGHTFQYTEKRPRWIDGRQTRHCRHRIWRRSSRLTNGSRKYLYDHNAWVYRNH